MSESAGTSESASGLSARVVVTPSNGEAETSGYEVRIRPGLLEELPAALRERAPAARYAVISDSTVAELYGNRVLDTLRRAGLNAELLVFPAGEAHKNRESWMDLSDRLLASRHGRDTTVLALGGGVTGDLAGFVAATYMRGLPLVQLPTTVLAMIDSSVGGKTGVDTPGGKNLIGAFLQPRFVLADTGTLRTLAPAEVRAGLAEAVKHGAIADGGYFRWISESVEPLLALDPSATVRLIGRSVEIKAAVVGADERENGLRKTLNFGHTVGHAIEARSAFSLLHGEAIAIGMVVEADLGEALGITEPGTTARIRELLERLGLPVTVPAGFTAAEVIELTRADKKARAGNVEYALLERIGTSSPGDGKFGIAVRDEDVAAALGRCRG
ncbi:MAG: 3-dehydroquinate synthase [Gemmatimonadota bacterium]|jgi:3-dehydroquinate synthase|nr:3-dehydroquinate synthase [Gemmatimonadota bacterium]